MGGVACCLVVFSCCVLCVVRVALLPMCVRVVYDARCFYCLRCASCAFCVLRCVLYAVCRVMRDMGVL